MYCPGSPVFREILLKTDKRQVEMVAEAGAKVRSRCAAWEEDRFLFPDQEAVIRFEHGQAYLTRQPRTDGPPMPATASDASPTGDRKTVTRHHDRAA